MRARTVERGMALMSALLLLLVTTILGIAMFRSFGILERVAGNTREKQRALHAAESAQTYAEWWLSGNQGLNATTGQTCAGALATAVICSNPITNVTTLPWATAVTYTPPGLPTGNTGTVGNYVSAPSFYITYLGNSYSSTPPGTQTYSYQVDAVGYAGSTSSPAVTESTYTVGITYTSADSLKKYINLGGP
jgi:type IV pilus assembly protein PilX